MDALIITRHGYSDYTGHLSLEGQEQISRLAEHLKPIIGAKKIIVLASTIDRARESGDIVAKLFSCPIEYHEILRHNDFINNK